MTVNRYHEVSQPGREYKVVKTMAATQHQGENLADVLRGNTLEVREVTGQSIAPYQMG